MAGFCGSPLWISPQNQSYLELTPCFLDTVLVYAPASYIYLVLPLYIGVLRRFTIPANRHNILNITKTVLSCMLCALCVCDVVAHIYTQTTTSQTLYLSTILAPCCRFSTLALSVLWIQYGRYKSDISSGSLLAFWLISCVCAVLTLYHHIIVYTKHLADTSSVYNIVIWSFNCCLVAVQFILAGLADRAQKLKPNECPEEKVAFFSKITYWWLTGLIYAGFKNPLERKDLWTLASWDECSAVVPKFFHQWERELNKTKGSLEHAPQTGPVSKGGPARNGTTSEVSYKTEDNKTYIAVKQPLTSREPSLVQALIRAFYPTFLHGVAYKVFHDALLFVGPFLLKELIIYVHTEDAPAWRGYMYACFMFLAAVAQSLVLHQYFQTSFRLGMHIRTSLVAAVYRKSLKLTSSARRESTVGEIVNLMSVDAQRFVELATYLHMIWSAPLQMVICMYFLWLLLGPSVLAGVLVMLLMIPFNAFIAKVLRTLQITQMKHKDSRIKLMNEVLNGIKVLKLYAWENSFYKNILGIRDAEIKVLRRSAYLNGVSSFIWTCAPFMVSLCTFAVYVLSSDKNILDAEKAFVSLSLFNILRFPLSMLPTLIGSMVQISVSVKRLCTFLKHDEIDDADHDNDDTEIADDKTEKNSENRNGNNGQETKCDLTAIKLKDGDFNWMRGEEKLILKNINLEIKQGSLIAVVGTVGSGKSSLLSAILGEMNNVQGVVKVKGRVAYVSQQAWIQNRTLRDNILFNDKFDSTAYYKTLSSCALMPDLNVLPAGDQTEIGEKGINLSGGQKQRVSVARAVYGKADVYLFDDPLSAVDSQVGKHIFDKVIGPEGMLKCTTRILVTHSLSYLPQMDNILVIDNGAISEQGTYQQLLDVKDGVFAEVLKTYLKQDGEKTEDIEDVISLPDKALSRVRHDTLLSTSSTLESIYASMHSLNINASLEQLNRDCDEVDEKKSNVESPLTRKRLTSVRSNGANNIKEKDKLIEEERAEVGRVKLSVLVTYIRSIGVFICFVIFLLYLLTTCTTIGANFWLSDWADDALERKRDNSTESIEQDRNQRDLRLGVYGAFGFAQGVLIFMASITLAYGCTLASSLLHKQLLLNCLQLPISFYDVTPLGRIVNRFSKDLDSIDVVIPRFLEFWVKCTMHVIGVLFVISISTPLFLIVVVFLGIIYFIVQRVYVAGSRQLKRLESVTRSPIYSHFSETLQGVSTIRAYKQQKRFIQLSDEYIDENNVCTYPTIVSNRWLAIRLEFVGNCVVFFAALFAVIGRDYLTAGIVGLSVSYALNITQTLNWMVRMTSEIESNIVSVERIKEYTDEKTEAAWEKEETKPSADWPTEGRVSIEKYSTRYRAGLDLVLKEVSVSIEPAEKIGIVGRTGAGKSSITMGLFRIMEPSSGRILIDSVDIGTIGLHQLRSKITIIPQEPVLFAGTLRLNLDPCSEYSDEKLWSALEHSHLKPFVMAQAERLEYECAEGGENLSVGQRQLVCLARALLRNTRVLILDEATAAVDLETDDLIQSTIRTEFKSCTVITIAHRLNTIMDYDKLLVLDLGEVAAFDTPAALLEDKDGLFYKMAVDAGLVS